MTEREEQISKMLTCGIKAQWERLNDPKNAVKGKFSEDIERVKDNIDEETMELYDELNTADPYNYERIREEAADLKNYLDDLIMVCDNEIAKNKQK
jgi:hypothetical protein